VVDVGDPFILLVHQGMVEDVFLQDLNARGVDVLRSSPFLTYSSGHSGILVEYNDLQTSTKRNLRSQFLIGCDGAHSKVRKAIPGAEMSGEAGKAAWGVLDGVIETDFPDLWSKVVISSETEGTVLCIPRERNMTRLYIELHPNTAATESKEDSTQDFVTKRAKAILSPFKLSWKTVEWFGVYKVGQRVATRFSDDSEKVFIAGDAAHTHSPKAAQGMNVSMHDAFNLAWKLNLTIRGLALPSLLSTYEHERRKIAQDLIDFDYEHANAFSAGDPKALADNFAKNIRFISGVGAEYAENVLNLPEEMPRGGLRAGALLLPAKVTRYIDANPVDLQLDIPMLGQFRIFFITNDVKKASSFLEKVCEEAISRTILGRVSAAAEASYSESKPPSTEMDEFIQPQRYAAVSKCFTFALVASMNKEDVEISDLPTVLQDSRWTFYLDDVMGGKGMSCSEKWLGKLAQDEVAIVNVRPDGYVGSIGRWNASETNAGEKAARWLDLYYQGFLKA
jgi:phenol 2-monooxygenase